jgi:tetratricopeptide (TPR) repeat protein
MTRYFLIRELVATRRGRAIPGTHLHEALRLCRDLDRWRGKLTPDQASEFLRLRASALLEAGFANEALRLLVTRSNGRIALKLLRAEAELALSDEDVEHTARALKRFRECLDLDDYDECRSRDLPQTSAGVRAKVAECLLRLGRREQAASTIDRAVGAPIAGPGPWIARALLAIDRGDPAAAAVEYTEAVRVDPHDPWAAAGLGEARLAAGAADEALKPLGEALRLAPGWVAAEEMLAAALLIEGKRDEMQKAFRRHGGSPGLVGEAVHLLETAVQGTRPVVTTIDPETERTVRRILLRAASAGRDDVVDQTREGLSAPDSAIA